MSVELEERWVQGPGYVGREGRGQDPGRVGACAGHHAGHRAGPHAGPTGPMTARLTGAR